MKILQIFNRYAHVGGEELAVERITRDLEASHQVENITFSSGDWLQQAGFFSRCRQFLWMAWNPASIRVVFATISKFKPDVILLHNLMPVGSACLYWRLSRCGVPLIQYIHNFRPFSVNGYCWGGGRLLPQGLDKNYFPEIVAGSWQDSVLKTAWYAMLLLMMHATGIFRRIDGWIAISNFMRDTFTKGGIDPERIEVISHAWEATESIAHSPPSQPADATILFLGRMTEEKGVLTLLDAWARVEKSIQVGRLVLGGDGPLADVVRLRCAEMERADYVGFTAGEAKRKWLRGCTALAVPSVWWEPLGLVLYEAYEFSKPVIAARSGGIVENVEDGRSGWLHTPGDVEELSAHLIEAIQNPVKAMTLGKNGRALLLDRQADDWLERFNDFAGKVISQKTGYTSSDSLHTDHFPASDLQSPISIAIYLADQNPKLGRSLGISRMTRVVLEEMQTRPGLELRGITSRSSIRPPGRIDCRTLPWTTRNAVTRVLTDHLHPLLQFTHETDVWYFPKGFLPGLHALCSPSVVTIHDTIVQYYADHYPKWRTHVEYRYWASMLKHTLRHADHILTVSHSAKRQIGAFMTRHMLPEKEINVTYEPCLYESVPQPVSPAKGDYVLHLASREPHKRTAWLVAYWLDPANDHLPPLHMVGNLPDEVRGQVEDSARIVQLPFLDDKALRSQFMGARALVFPSEIEGFGLPAIEAYYLGTPVCHVRGTSVEEVLEVATKAGGFDLDQPETLTRAIDEVLALPDEEIYRCGLKLRETYAAAKVVDRMTEVFLKAGPRHRQTR